MIYTSDSYCIEMIKMIENDEMDLCYAFLSFHLSYHIVSYRFKWPLLNRFYRGSINPYLFLVQNDMDQLWTSAGV